MSATIGEIIHLTALNFSVDASDMIGARGNKHLSLARHTAMYLARNCTQAAYPAIGKVFGGRDHSTVIHSVELIETAIKTDPKLSALIKTLKQNLDFAEEIKSRGGIDVLALAKRIQRNPRQAALTASVHEIAALAATVLDIWELRDCYAELVAALRDSSDTGLIDDLTHNIETMKRLITGEDERDL